MANTNPISDKELEFRICGPQSEYDETGFDARFKGSVVLVTGAAGSIGSEIVRNLLRFEPERLILVDSSESGLYDLQQEIDASYSKTVVPLVADIRDERKMASIFEAYSPKLVFHAAAYKHVPLMELSPDEAVSVNVVGTKIIADLSESYGVDKLIFISTDKAVNPASVMGASKRIAELYLSSLNGHGHTEYITARFGNVLGSSGSVVPIFKQQLAAGGPLTITHGEATRYFMTMRMASHLVLTACFLGHDGEIFTCNMGEPVSILELARIMSDLAGFKNFTGLDIEYIGLRAGEKMTEELHTEQEHPEPAGRQDIFVIRPKIESREIILAQIDYLTAKYASLQNIQIVNLMKRIVPDYRSNNSIYSVLDAPT